MLCNSFPTSAPAVFMTSPSPLTLFLHPLPHPHPSMHCLYHCHRVPVCLSSLVAPSHTPLFIIPGTLRAPACRGLCTGYVMVAVVPTLCFLVYKIVWRYDLNYISGLLGEMQVDTKK